MFDACLIFSHLSMILCKADLLIVMIYLATGRQFHWLSH